MPYEEILQKMVGDIPDEIGEAGHRTMASALVKIVQAGWLDHLGADNTIKKLLNDNKQLEEGLVSFTLAAILEVVPIPRLGDDTRKRLAYNLRVRTYEKIGELVIHKSSAFIPFIQDAVERAIELTTGGSLENTSKRAKLLGERTSKVSVQSAPEASEAAGTGEGHEGAAAAATGESKAKRSTHALESVLKLLFIRPASVASDEYWPDRPLLH